VRRKLRSNSIAWPRPSDFGRTYPQIGVPEAHHPTPHHQNDPEKLAKLTKINTYHAVDKKGDTAMHGAAYKQFPSIAQFLVDHGAAIDSWNTKNTQGWTPLRIAVGVHRGMNFRFSPQTAAVLERVMKAAGVSTVVEPKKVIGGATK